MKKVMHSKTYMTQAKIVGLLVRILEDVGENVFKSATEQIQFHHKEKTNKIIMKDFLAIKSSNFTQVRSSKYFINGNISLKF